MDISSLGHFGTCMFRPCGRTGTWTFRLNGCFDTRTFRHGDILAQGIFSTMDVSAQDISAPEHFSTWIFWHLAKQYGHFGKDILAPVLLCRNVHVLNVPVPKCPWCRKILVLNIHGDNMSMCRNTYCTCMCQNVLVMKYLCQNVRCRNGGKL